MDLSDKYSNALSLVKKYGQEHLLSFYDGLSEGEKEQLLNQILNIDFEQAESLYRNAKNNDSVSSEDVIEPVLFTEKSEIPENTLECYEKTGKKIISEGKFAAVTMAGGQGTRLGHTGPKGTFKICIPEEKSLFQIQCERLIHTSRECCGEGGYIPWYIMTSRENDGETRKFFEDNNYFGYDKNSIIFFVQGMLPMIDFDGKIVLAEKGKIKEGADGHGGIFSAMLKTGVYDDMKKRGIKWIFIGGIDNVLLKLCDSAFIGFVNESGCGIGGKSLVKRDAKEKVGVFCKNNGKPYVIEYTEISEEMANARDDKGQWLFGESHILCNIFNISACEKMFRDGAGLPYHTAVKKTAFINSNGETVTPDQPNAYKFEAFIFDAFKYFDDIAILRVDRNEEFAPIKNKDGNDSPETAKELYMNAVNKF